MSHPNPAGAKSYADNAIMRLTQHLEVTDEIDRAAQPGSPLPTLGGETLEDKLTRYRLRTAGPLRGDVGHLDVDSLAVRVITAADSDQNFFANVWLYVTTNANYGRAGSREYPVNFPYRSEETLVPGRGGPLTLDRAFWFHKYYPHFEPGQTHRYTMDTMGGLRLDEIVGCHLWVGDDPLAEKRARERYGKVWRPETVTLEVNGQEVVSLDLLGQRFGFGDSIDLSYPTPQPNVSPPRMAPLRINSVRPPARRRAPRVPAQR
jgi:hypothetical protein